MAKKPEYITLNGHQLPVYPGVRGGGYITIKDLAAAIGSNHSTLMRHMRADGKASKLMSMQYAKNETGSLTPMQCLSLRYVLESFFLPPPKERIGWPRRTRIDLLRLYDFYQE